MPPTVLDQGREHGLPPLLLGFPNDTQGVQPPHAVRAEATRPLAAANPLQPRGQLAIGRPCVGNIAMPMVPMKSLQLGHHGIPIPGNPPPRPHGPHKANCVEPLEPLRIENSQLLLTAAVEDPDGQ